MPYSKNRKEEKQQQQQQSANIFLHAGKEEEEEDIVQFIYVPITCLSLAYVINLLSACNT